ncbi:MAG: 3-deoxy-7-phosphoheptulonate synthase [Saprospiraceae bacterium]|nr:3-deoxy-7-phosphoheptulonate synthase [Saprospiraceae bacterium]
MIIQLEKSVSEQVIQDLQNSLKEIGYNANEVRTQYDHYLICIGKKPIDLRTVGCLDGVKDIHKVTDPYKLVSRQWRVEDTVVDLGDDVKLGTGHFHIMAGPCSIESEKQVNSTVKHLKENGVRIMRGGVYKPRSSPYSFRGMGIDGLKMFHRICSDNGIKIITEVMMVEQIDDMFDYIDIFQVGARNAQNFNLLDALGQVDKPVMLKRGISGTIDELLYAAEYVFSNGNERILLCERGIRSYENAYRNTMDVNAIAMLKDKTHLPVIGDPSHGIGIRKFVEPIALAAVMAGADGIIMEVHETPEKALSDGQQTLNYDEAGPLYIKMRQAFQMRTGWAN